MTVVDLTLRRLGRLEKAQQETNKRLGRVEDVLGRAVDVLEVHSRHFERMEEALIGISERVDRLTSAIVLSTARIGLRCLSRGIPFLGSQPVPAPPWAGK
jgi:hypothetical protein